MRTTRSGREDVRNALTGLWLSQRLDELTRVVEFGVLIIESRNLEALVRQADVIVGAVGRPEFIRADWIKDGAVVVDAGYHPGGVGDIELAPLADRVSAMTPVPGGVGPMTINTLIQQTVLSGERALA